MKCPSCGVENPNQVEFCTKCSHRFIAVHPIVDMRDSSEKRRELQSWVFGRGRVEIIVRPNSPEAFVSVSRSLPGGWVKSVSSRESWINALVFLIATYVLVSVLTLWIFAYVGALMIGIVFVLLVGLVYLPQFWLFIWPFLPPKDNDTRSDE